MTGLQDHADLIQHTIYTTSLLTDIGIEGIVPIHVQDMIPADADHPGMVLDIVPILGTVNFQEKGVILDKEITQKIETSGTLEIVLGTVPDLAQLTDHIVPLPGTVECPIIVKETLDAHHKTGTDGSTDGLETGTDVPAETILLTEGTIVLTDISLLDDMEVMTKTDDIMTKISHVQKMVLTIRITDMIIIKRTTDDKKVALLIILLINQHKRLI